jgi:bifunctional DNA-binding transcriptional regulator/antitoxin component of YhaV-PrlF toxin-antitoxin module
MIYTVQTFENEDGDLILPLPEEVLKQLGWTEGTIVEFIDNKDGSFSLIEKKETNRSNAMIERIKSWFNWRGKSSYNAIQMNSMTKEEADKEEATARVAKAESPAKKKATKKKAAKKAAKKKVTPKK